MYVLQLVRSVSEGSPVEEPLGTGCVFTTPLGLSQRRARLPPSAGVFQNLSTSCGLSDATRHAAW